MAPEQARDSASVDARADVFGLAATLFFALTGHDPFRRPAGRPPRPARRDSPTSGPTPRRPWTPSSPG